MDTSSLSYQFCTVTGNLIKKGTCAKIIENSYDKNRDLFDKDMFIRYLAFHVQDNKFIANLLESRSIS